MGVMLHDFVQVTIVRHFATSGAAIEIALLVRGQLLVISSTHSIDHFIDNLAASSQVEFLFLALNRKKTELKEVPTLVASVLRGGTRAVASPSDRCAVGRTLRRELSREVWADV